MTEGLTINLRGGSYFSDARERWCHRRTTENYTERNVGDEAVVLHTLKAEIA